MTFRKTCCALIAGVIFPVAGLCQSMGYLDADSFGEAVGMLYATKISNRVMQEQCVASLPELKDSIAADLATWQEKEAAIIAKADVHFQQFKKQNPQEAGNYVGMVEEMLTKNMAIMAQLPGDAGKSVLRQACVGHFSALASGAWRKRTPNVYKYMDEAP